MRKEPPRSKESGDKSPADAAPVTGSGTGGRPAARKAAEWVTLAVSLVLVLGVAGFLVHQAVNEDSMFVATDVKVRVDQAVEREGKHVVPVRVENLGRRTLKDLKVRVSYLSTSGQRESEDLVIDFLGERASATLFLYVDRDPRQARIEARAFSYRLE